MAEERPKRPELPRTPLELLDSRTHDEYSLYTKYGLGASGAALGFACAIFMNYLGHRPIFAGIQTHILLTTLGGYGAHSLWQYRLKQYAQRDALFRHYVINHPEDFPPFERKTYGEVFQKWIPVR